MSEMPEICGEELGEFICQGEPNHVLQIPLVPHHTLTEKDGIPLQVQWLWYHEDPANKVVGS